MEHVKEGGLHTPNSLPVAEAITGGFAPQYVMAPRLVGHLACGELAVEPVLGVVRVAGVRRHGQSEDGNEDGSTKNRSEDVSGEAAEQRFVHVTWRDEHGPGTATARYPADRSFDVRMPAPEDRLLVRRGIDQAKWHGRVITDDTARLIAAHLNPGERSALHRFMIDGSVDEQVRHELALVARHRRYAREWAGALLGYCLAREDTRPIEAWVVRTRAYAEAEARAEVWLSEAGVSVDALHDHVNGNGSRSGNGKGAGDGRGGGDEEDQPTPYGDLLSRKHMTTEIAAQLIDAAFLLGVAAARKRVLPAMVERRFGQPVAVPVDQGTA